MNQINKIMDISKFPTDADELKGFVLELKERIGELLKLSLNVPQLKDVYDLLDKINQLNIARDGLIKAVTINIPYNKMDKDLDKRTVQILSTIQETIDRGMEVALILIKGNPISGRGETGISSYDFMSEVIEKLDQKGLAHEVGLYTGLYPTNVASYTDLGKSWLTNEFNEKQTSTHLSTQVEKAQRFTEDFGEYLNGFVTQIVDSPILAANFVEQIMDVAPGKNLFIGTSLKSNEYHLRVIRTQLAKLTGNKDFTKVKTDGELVKLILHPNNWKHMGEIVRQTGEPINRDMLVRILASRGICTNVMAQIYKILGERGNLDSEQIDLLHPHLNFYDTSRELSGESAKVAMDAKAYAFALSKNREYTSKKVVQLYPESFQGQQGLLGVASMQRSITDTGIGSDRRI